MLGHSEILICFLRLIQNISYKLAVFCIIYKTVLHVFKSPNGLSALYIDPCGKIRSRPSSVTTRSSNYIFLEVPRSKKLAGESLQCVCTKAME